MLNKIPMYKLLGYVFALCILILSLTFAYTSLVPIDVIKNWTIQTEKDSYVAGEEAVIDSSLIKTLNVAGQSKRSLICNINGSEQAFPINSAIADNPLGSRQSKLHMIIPKDVPSLPKTCRINVSIQYRIYLWRFELETVDSNDFIVTKS